MKLPQLAPLGQGSAGTPTPMRDPTYITLRLKRLVSDIRRHLGEALCRDPRFQVHIEQF